MLIARFGPKDEGLARVRLALREAAAGYDLASVSERSGIEAADVDRIVFVHGTRERAGASVGGERAEIALGDAVVLRAGAELVLDRPLSFVVFALPEPVEVATPVFLRPDADPRLTDTPGGCATESDAYRRVMLTWLSSNGPYTCRALNCHRVRMTDSFSHYHPRDGGFEEIYLVHDVRPGGRLLWSPDVARIEARDAIDAQSARALVRSAAIAPGDVVFIPRGTMHRAVGGVLAHVVTIPGFVPMREIGLDHHLRAIAERFGLGPDELPWQREASLRAVVK
ncbi:MAG: hypothetical protein U1F36_20815 [Planctomycetota bacterium]